MRVSYLRAGAFVIALHPAGCNGGTVMMAGDGGADGGVGLAVLGRGAHVSGAVEVVEIVRATDGLRTPSDLAFHPTQDHQLWITNHGGNSVTIVSSAGAAGQSIVTRTSAGADHFLAAPSSLAFGASGRLATAQDMDRVTQPRR